MKYLFLGGKLDGKRRDVAPWQRVFHEISGGKAGAKYRRMHLALDNGPAVRVFVHDALPALNAVKMLVAQYRTTLRNGEIKKVLEAAEQPVC